MGSHMKNMKVSWDHYSQYMGKSNMLYNKIHVPNHQPDQPVLETHRLPVSLISSPRARATLQSLANPFLGMVVMG